MRGELVAVDLETTGLDVARDDIIEIGAVRTRDGEILDEFSVLVNPGRPIPSAITHLTGIRSEDVLDAPGIQAVLPQLRAFVGNAPWIAHNIGFDSAFLYRHGILRSNVRIDTYELASVLLPRAPRYNLTSLSSITGVEIEAAHRAVYEVFDIHERLQKHVTNEAGCPATPSGRVRLRPAARPVCRRHDGASLGPSRPLPLLHCRPPPKD